MALDFPPGFPFRRPVEAQEAVPPAAHDAASPVEPGQSDSGQAEATALRIVPQLMLAPAGRAPAVERRRAPRQTLVAKASIRPDTAVQMASLTSAGFVSNISMNGVGFHTRKPLAIGEKYRITLELGPMKWSCRMRIVSCRHHEDSETFDVGAEFVGNELSRHAA